MQDQVDNPYQPPRTLDQVSAAVRWKQRLWNVWVFAMIWPFVAILFHRLTLPFTPMLVSMLGSGWSPFTQFISLFPFLIGWAVCITAAIRYPAGIWTKILRGIGSLLVLFVFAQVARLAFALIYWSLR